MKALLVTTILVALSYSRAEAKILLYCKNIGRDDLKEILISSSNSKEQVEVQEILPNGDSNTRKVDFQEFIEGYVSLGQNNSPALIRKEKSWEISSAAGEYKNTAHAECVE